MEIRQKIHLCGFTFFSSSMFVQFGWVAVLRQLHTHTHTYKLLLCYLTSECTYAMKSPLTQTFTNKWTQPPPHKALQKCTSTHTCCVCIGTSPWGTACTSWLFGHQVSSEDRTSLIQTVNHSVSVCVCVLLYYVCIYVCVCACMCVCPNCWCVCVSLDCVYSCGFLYCLCEEQKNLCLGFSIVTEQWWSET